jgi:formylmethanofuran dehydrogenase subunit C
MNSSPGHDVLTLNARKLSLLQLNENLRDVPSSITSIRIVGCQAPDLLAPGLIASCSLSIEGDLGDYCLCGMSNAEVAIRGRAGCGLGEATESGSIILDGDAGDSVGAFSRGGLITIMGSAGRRAAVGMSGGDVVIHGAIGSQGAMGMTTGTLLVLGGAGAMLGQEMQGGTIYIRGEVESMAPHIEESRMREADRLRIGLLFLKAGIQGDSRDLRVLKVGAP